MIVRTSFTSFDMALVIATLLLCKYSGVGIAEPDRDNLQRKPTPWSHDSDPNSALGAYKEPSRKMFL